MLVPRHASEQVDPATDVVDAPPISGTSMLRNTRRVVSGGVVPRLESRSSGAHVR